MSFEPTAKGSTRLAPEVAWSMLTEAPLKGLGLAREAGSVIAWDETDQLYRLDLRGEYQSVARAPGKLLTAAISDDGSRLALLGEKGTLWLLDSDLQVVAERQGPAEPISLTIDPHGRFVLIATRTCVNHYYSRHGKPAGKFPSRQPLAFAAFIADQPVLAAAASYGMLATYRLSDAGSGRLDTELEWEDRQISSVGRLATTGDGSMLLASCFTHGVQRFDLLGHNEGSYHLGGTATHAVPDFAGRTIAVATSEGDLSVLSSAGNVRWKTGLARPAIALEVDPLGRYLIHGNASGEVVRLDLYGSGGDGKPRPRPTPTPRADDNRPRPNQATLRVPDWKTPAATSDEQAETAVLGVLDDPGRVALYASKLRLHVFRDDGESLGFAPEILGVGRILRTSPGWIAAATDRQLVVYHAAKNAAQRVDLSLVEVTHLAIRPDSFGLAIVQERDRVGRATIAGRWVWKHELKTPIEDVAIGADGYLAATDDSGFLQVFDAAGLSAGTYQADSAEPLSLIEAVSDAPQGVAWITLARRSQVLRGHERGGRVVWESPVGFEAWLFQRFGKVVVISAADGRAQAFDGSGHLRGQGKASEGGAHDHFSANAKGEPRRVTRQGGHLICADLNGRVSWRCVCDEPIGPIAVGQTGVAALIGRSLAWFQGLD